MSKVIRTDYFRKSQNLKYFPIYTKKHCIYECLIDIVYASCECMAPYFPRTVMLYAKENCTFSQHSFCVANHITAFNHELCHCKEECFYGTKFVYYKNRDPFYFEPRFTSLDIKYFMRVNYFYDLRSKIR